MESLLRPCDFSQSSSRKQSIGRALSGIQETLCELGNKSLLSGQDAHLLDTPSRRRLFPLVWWLQSFVQAGFQPHSQPLSQGPRGGHNWNSPMQRGPRSGAQIPPLAGLSHSVLLPPGFSPEEWASSISSFILPLLPSHPEGVTTFSGPRTVLFYLTENVSGSW